MHPLHSPTPPTLFAFHCPPPLTPTTPPPHDPHFPSIHTPQKPQPAPHPNVPPHPSTSSIITLLSPHTRSIEPPRPPPASPSLIPIANLHRTPKRRRRTHPPSSPAPFFPSPSLSNSPTPSLSPSPSPPSPSDPPNAKHTLFTHTLAKNPAANHTAANHTPAKRTPVTRTRKPRTPSSKYAHGLKDFTTTVATKLRIYGSASYTSVADELVEDAFSRLRAQNIPFNQAEVDKNVRRRVYDALNVFTSMRFVHRNGKTVVWKGKEAFLQMVGMSSCGCPDGRHTCALALIDTQKRQNNDLNAMLRHKRARLDELRRQEQFVRCIVQRNASKHCSRVTTGSDVRVGDDLEFKRPDNHRVDLPFVMVSASPGTSVSVEMEDNRENIVLDFDQTFRLWDGFSIVGRVVQRGHGGGGILYDGAVPLSGGEPTFHLDNDSFNDR